MKSVSRRVEENTSVEQSLAAVASYTKTPVHLSHFLCVSVQHAIPSLVDFLGLNKFHEDISPTTHHFKGDFVCLDFVFWGFSTRTRFRSENVVGFLVHILFLRQGEILQISSWLACFTIKMENGLASLFFGQVQED